MKSDYFYISVPHCKCGWGWGWGMWTMVLTPNQAHTLALQGVQVKVRLLNGMSVDYWRNLWS